MYKENQTLNEDDITKHQEPRLEKKLLVETDKINNYKQIFKCSTLLNFIKEKYYSAIKIGTLLRDPIRDLKKTWMGIKLEEQVKKLQERVKELKKKNSWGFVKMKRTNQNSR